MKKQELNNILKKREESLTIEFKQVAVLKNNKEISRQLISFANAKGGKLLIGVTDDGRKQGEKIDYDKARNKIASIAKNCCSPAIEFESHYFPSKEGDVLVIDIAKRRDIPHAIVERKNHEIFNRLYFIRTADGTKTISDFELKWLFLKLEQDLYYTFLIQLNLGINKSFSAFFNDLKEFDFQPYGINHLHSQRFYNQIIYLLKREETKRLKTEGEGLNQLSLFLFDMLPYVVLTNISNYYTKSWDIEIISNSPLKTRINDSNLKSSEISLDKLHFEGVEAFSEIKEFDFEKYFKYFNKQFHVPENTCIVIKRISQENKPPIQKIIINKEDFFLIEIEFSLKGWNKIDKEPEISILPLPDTTFRVDIETKFSVDIDSNSMLKREYEKYVEYSKTLLELLKWNFDYDYTQDKLSPNQLILMNKNIKNILQSVNKLERNNFLNRSKSESD